MIAVGDLAKAAGGLGFPVAPLQREAERLAEKGVPLTAPVGGPFAPAPAPNADRRASLYKKAARSAIRDGRISPEEELYLFGVTQDLGLGAGQAMRLRQKVQREALAGVA